MFTKIYGEVFNVIKQKPLKLWGISLLAILLTGIISGICGAAVPVVGTIVGLLISTAMTVIFLKGFRGEEIDTTMLFMCFKDWNTIKRVLLGLGWMYLWVLIWGLIPVVGPIFAIIRTYEYRLTPYILLFNPEVSVTDAIKVSREKTEGYKLQMWLADFVFAIALLVAFIILSLFAAIPFLGLIFALSLFALVVCSIIFSPLFLGLVQAAFYEEITCANARFCTDCGERLADGAAFCSKCGKPIE